MPQEGRIVRVFVGSPTDLAEERKIIPEVIDRWNMMHSVEKAAVVLPVLWESHASPNLDAAAQEVINRDLLKKCDFLIAVFWTTLGGGGTVDEIEEALKAGKRVILYFSEKSIPQQLLDATKWKELQKYKERMKGLYGTFENDSELQNHLLRDVNDAVGRILGIRSETTPFLARLVGRTEIPNPGHGASAKSGLYDWVESEVQPSGMYGDKVGGRTGTAKAGTAAIEAMFTNTAVDVSKNKIVDLQPLPAGPFWKDSFSGERAGWSYRFDLNLTNESNAARAILTPINRNIHL